MAEPTAKPSSLERSALARSSLKGISVWIATNLIQ